jgi:NADH dehydrogenase [ubiquinone] 1 alpha subcomplex assembly factor 7
MRFRRVSFAFIQKTRQGWQEVLVSSVDIEAPATLKNPSTSHSSSLSNTHFSHSPLRRVLSPSPTPSSTTLGLSSPRFGQLPIGSQLEVSPAAFKMARKVGEVLQGPGDRKGPGGSALIVDYGAEKSFGDSLRVSFSSSFSCGLVEHSLSLGI